MSSKDCACKVRPLQCAVNTRIFYIVSFKIISKFRTELKGKIEACSEMIMLFGYNGVK